MHPKYLSITDFTYDLPDEKIAKHPLPQRDASKLLVYAKGEIFTTVYSELPTLLNSETMLVFNKTRVIEARILFRKSSGGVIEIFCLEPAAVYPDITTAMLSTKNVLWKCLVGGASKWKHGLILEKNIGDPGQEILLQARITGRTDDSFLIQFSWDPPEHSFAEILHMAGLIPLPPYLHREAEADDKQRYQTIYAREDGSVAAPTAGLHFTGELMEKLASNGVKQEFVTLHVGAGTFKPVKASIIAEHEMHAEFMEVSAGTLSNIINNLQQKIVAVGTTSMRTLESLYWMGLKIVAQPGTTTEDLNIGQWYPYESDIQVDTATALQALLNWMNVNRITTVVSKTQILIAPGYQFKVVKGLLTNFHQPQSTLLLLVAAITGHEWKTIYDYALSNDFRFLSYGDGCLIWI